MNGMECRFGNKKREGRGGEGRGHTEQNNIRWK
jgi:hypothetical protein